MLRLRRQGGFTLVELMLSMVLGLIVLAALVSYFVANLRASHQTMEVARLNQEMQGIVGVISRDLRRAGYKSDIRNDPSDEFEFRLSDLGLQDGTSSIYRCIAMRADLDNSGSLTDGDYSGYIFDTGNNRVRRWSADSQPSCVLTSGDWETLNSDNIVITDLRFEFDEGLVSGAQTGTYSVNIALEGHVQGQSQLKMVLEQTVRLRNDRI